MIARLGIVGAFRMGAGIAQCAAAAGLSVTLVDRESPVAAVSSVRAALDADVEKGRLNPARLASLRLVAGDIADLAGLHFFNPVPRMQLVEAICADAQWPVLAGFAQALGKTALRATDSPGSIVTRCALPNYRESLRLRALTGRSPADYALIELNEAFAAQALARPRAWGLPDDAAHVNPQGGAIARGHPLGMTGARLALSAALGVAAGTQSALVTLCVGVEGVALSLARP